MDWQELHCRLDECEVDGTTHMAPEKCFANEKMFMICPQLEITNHTDVEKVANWKKLENVIDKRIDKSVKRGKGIG